MEIVKKYGFQIALLFSVIVLLTGVLGYTSGAEGLKEQGLVNAPLMITYVMVIVGVALSVGMPLIKSLQAPETLKKSGIAFGIVLILFGIAYNSANGVVPADTDGTYVGITSSNLKLAGGLVTTAWILSALGIVGLIVLEVKSLIKR